MAIKYNNISIQCNNLFLKSVTKDFWLLFIIASFTANYFQL